MLDLKVGVGLRHIICQTGWDAKLLQSIKPILTFSVLRIKVNISIVRITGKSAVSNN
jgi:hypothetical protein